MVVIDPGHGGHDPGATEGDLIEKNMALALAKQIAASLTDRFEVDVRMTRESDRFIQLSERAEFANKLGADYFVSVHHNRAGGSGFESFIFPGTTGGVTGTMQQAVHQHIMDYMRQHGVRDRGKKTANFAVLRETAMPAVLLEFLFIDQPQDAQLLRDQTFMQHAARATADGIAAAMQLPPKSSRGNGSSGGAEHADADPGSEGESDSRGSSDAQTAPPQWKQDAVDWLYQQQLLTDEIWRQKADDPVPLWAIAVMLRRLYEQK